MFSNGRAEPLREPDPPSENSDIGLQNGFVDKYGDDLRYVATLDAWFVYTVEEGRWTKDEKMEVWTRAKRFLVAASHKAVDSIPNEKAAAQVGKQISSKTTVAAVVTLARSHPRIALLESAFDADPWQLNTPAGVVDLKTGNVRKALREDYFTETAKVGPKDEPTPVFDRFMLDIMGVHFKPHYCSCAPCAKPENQQLSDEARLALHLAEVDALVAYLMRCYGYALTGDVSEEKLLIQIGDGGNGKGKLNDFLSRDIFGLAPTGYSCEIPIEALLESHNDRHPTDLMGLWHTRLAIARESDEDTRWNEGRVKKLSGGDPITAHLMRKDFVTFPASHKLVIFGQAKPRLKSSEQAAWKRRLQMTPFPQKFDDEADEAEHVRKADKKLIDALRKEASGVLHKLIQACLKYQKLKGLNPPDTVREASTQYLASASTLLTWIEERLEKDGVTNTTVNDLWPDYTRWCEARRDTPCGRQIFNDKLESAGISIFRTGKVKGICRGVKLKGFEVKENGREY
jgi:putative DNA primase/helicase